MGDVEQKAKVAREMVAFDPHYWKSLVSRQWQALHLEEQVRANEARGSQTACSHQILTETFWLLGNTADFAAIDRRLRDLKASIAASELESTAGEQDPEDGSWGRCYSEWFFKVDASIDHVLLDPERAPERPMRLLDRVNSPEKLASYFASVAVSDIARTGIDHRREFNEMLADLTRLILHDWPRGYAWHPRLKETLMDLLLHKFRNRDTAWWGESYVRNGHVEFVDDLSMTYHVVTYLKGDVPDLDVMVNTLLALKDEPYPVGWRNSGRYSNHHNMDVVTLLRFGWPYLKPEQKQAAAAEIDKMLRWCLAESLQADGSFRQEPGDDSIEEVTYFGVEFLARTGYFDPSRRFWTGAKLPDSQSARRSILAFIEKHHAAGGAGGEYYRGALKDLEP